MTNNNITNKMFLSLMIPFILSTITQPLLGAADMAVIGKLNNTNFISGVSIGTLIFNTIYWIFGFLKALAEDQNFKYELLPLGFQASMEALDNEEVDAIFSGMSISEARKEIDDVIFVEYNIANGLKVKMPLGEEDYSECAVMVKKGKNKEFIEVINRGLSNLKKNGKYEEIINKYLN